MVLYPWLRIAVPLFFIMSSYFVFLKIQNASASKQTEILKKFVFRNLQLYLYWFVILLPITLYVRKQVYFSNGVLKNTLTIIKSFLFGSTFVASWFIMATVIGVLIIYLLSKLLKKDYVVFVISFFAFCIVTLASGYLPFISGTFIDRIIDKYINIFGSLVLSFPASLFWIFIGKMFAEQKIKVKSLWWLLCFIAISAMGLFMEWKWLFSMTGSYNNDSYFMLAPLCIFLFCAIQKVRPIHWEKSVYFKRASTVIYVSHGSIVRIVNKFLDMFFHVKSALISFLITFLSCILIYIFIEILIKKFHKNQIGNIFKRLY